MLDLYSESESLAPSCKLGAEFKQDCPLQCLHPVEHSCPCFLHEQAVVEQVVLQPHLTIDRSSSWTAGLSVYTGKSIPWTCSHPHVCGSSSPVPSLRCIQTCTCRNVRSEWNFAAEEVGLLCSQRKSFACIWWCTSSCQEFECHLFRHTVRACICESIPSRCEK